ncbi:MAG: alginate lyase family protein [Gammaproteobacteria bacterium]|nr:alginate lyase family protein [Gammaproteobacteria bacterium]
MIIYKFILIIITAALISPSFAKQDLDVTPVTDKSSKSKIAYINNFDPHDYLSFSPYWWPDPNSPNGLPYIRKDGVRNKQLVDLGDAGKFKNLAKTVISLTKDYKNYKNNQSAKQAVEYLRLWFLNSDTAMNPNLNYAQVVLGRNNNKGNPEGILEFRYVISLLKAIDDLAEAKMLAKTDYEKLKNWFANYLNWLTTSELGRKDAIAGNNHQSWYAAQIVSIALFTSQQDVARQKCEDSKILITNQINPDGKQSLELKRTRALTYSLFNLEALFVLAKACEQVKINLWNSNLSQAYTFILKYKSSCNKSNFTQNCRWGDNYLQIDPVENWRWDVLEKPEEIYYNIIQ